MIRWCLIRSSQCLAPACTSFGNSAGAPLAGFVTAHSRHSNEAFDQVRAKRQLEAGFYHQCVEGDQQGAAIGRSKHHSVSADVAERTGAVVNTVTGRPRCAHGHGLSAGAAPVSTAMLATTARRTHPAGKPRQHHIFLMFVHPLVWRAAPKAQLAFF